MIWSLGIRSEIFPIYSGSVLHHFNTVNTCVYTSMDLRRDRKRSLKFTEMLKTQVYAQAQDAEERRQREAQSIRRYIFKDVCYYRKKLG